MQLSKNFWLVEFGCRSGECVPDNLIANVQRVATQLQVLRDHIKMPIAIVSGYRSPTWNIGRGVKKSRHLTACAADIRVNGVDVSQLHATIRELIAAGKMSQGGLGLYLPNAKRRAGWVHYDADGSGKRRRWNG